jgi:hypothetical protein
MEHGGAPTRSGDYSSASATECGNRVEEKAIAPPGTNHGRISSSNQPACTAGSRSASRRISSGSPLKMLIPRNRRPGSPSSGPAASRCPRFVQLGEMVQMCVLQRVGGFLVQVWRVGRRKQENGGVSVEPHLAMLVASGARKLAADSPRPGPLTAVPKMPVSDPRCSGHAGKGRVTDRLRSGRYGARAFRHRLRQGLAPPVQRETDQRSEDWDRSR